MQQQITTTWQQNRTENIRSIATKGFVDMCHEVFAGKDDASSYREWLIWGKDTFGWSESTMNDMTNVSLMVSKSVTVINYSELGNTVLRQISPPSIPQEAREEVVKHAKENGKVTVAETQAIIERYKQEGRLEQLEKDQETLESWKKRVADLRQEITGLETLVRKHPTDTEGNREKSERIKQLEQELEAYKRREFQDEMDALEPTPIERIRSRWVSVAYQFGEHAGKLLGVLPSIADIPLLEASDWQRIDDMEWFLKDLLQRVDELKQGRVVESEEYQREVTTGQISKARVVEAGK